MSTWRLVAAIVLVATTGVLAGAGRDQPAAAPALLSIPYTVGEWAGSDAAADTREADAITEADQLLDREYHTADGALAGLYVAYYARQRPGISIHSPLHCLPGTGWDILSTDTEAVTLPGRAGEVRRLIARKDTARIVVLYWYQIHGRMIASDLRSRVQLFSDRLRLGRNDATLVRLVMPITDEDGAAERSGLSFMHALAPYL